MPLRRWFTSHDLPGWYSWVVVVGLTVSSIGLSTVVNLNATHHAVESERRAREQAVAERAKASAAALAVFCRMVITQEGVFSEAQSQVGRNAAKAWHDLGVTIGCYKE